MGFKRWLALGWMGALATACGSEPVAKPPGVPQSFLFIGSSAAIEIFNISPDANGVPTFVRTSGRTAVAVGAPSAMSVVNTSLYVAGNGGSIAEYAIDPVNGALSLRGSIPTGAPPYTSVATGSTLYVAGHGSSDVRAYAIDGAGKLANLQTVEVPGVTALHLDASGTKFLFTGGQARGATPAQVCAYAIQSDGTLASTPQCTTVPSGPRELEIVNGVLFMLLSVSGPGGSSSLSAWTIDPTTAALTHRGTDLDLGPAKVGGMAASTDGSTLYFPRQGSFTTVGTTDPLVASAVTFPPSGSQLCKLPPPGAGQVLVDRTGRAIYFTDPIGQGGTKQNGPRATELAVVPDVGLKPLICDTIGAVPLSMAMFVP